MNWKIPLYKIFWDEEDVKNVTETIKQGVFWATGPKIEEFERITAKYLGTKFAISFNSGTSALHAILMVYGIEEGDEVIVPSFTFIATANSVLFVNAKPVFAEIEEETYGLSPEDVKTRISPKTKAIIPVHIGGLPCHIRELREIADDHGILLIEDAAESLGANINGKKVGTFGDAAMFSFCGNKAITTGEGGVIVTDSRSIYEKLKLIRSHGRLETENYFTSSKLMDYVVLGFNWRMSSITAALGVSQMKKIDKVIDMRKRNAEYLTQELSKIRGIKTPSVPPGYHHIYQMYTIKTIRRDLLKDYLTKKGIITKIYFQPVHLTEFYRKQFKYKRGELPITEKLAEQVLTLPMYPTLTKEDMNYIATSIEEFYSDVAHM